jgi:predicted Zn-dependent protease with MMP-like domain
MPPVEPRDFSAPAPSAEEFDTLVRQAFAALPDRVRDACEGLALCTADFASDEVLDGLGIEDPYELTGLYDGIALTDRSVFDQPLQPDAVWLFRRPILEEWIERGNVPLDGLVRHVLVHEIAHHLGWSDDDIRAIDDWTE